MNLTNDTTGYFPEYLGNIAFTSYFSVRKTNPYDIIQVYKLTALPFFIVEEDKGKELSGLPKMIGMSNNGYIEWRENEDKVVCDFGDYTVYRDPPIVQKRINNMCLEQLISTNRSFHCQVRNSLYISPHFEKISSDVIALSTRTSISCAITGGYHVFKNLTIVHVGCNDSFYCEGNINFIGDKRCQKLKPYILKTISEDFVPVVECIRPLNISLPKVYPFASDKNLILNLEEQMRIQEKNIKETEKTGNNLSRQGNLSTTRPMVIILTVPLSILLIAIIFLAVCLIYRCRRDSQTSTTSVPQSTKDNMGSLYDLLTALALNKAEINVETSDLNPSVMCTSKSKT